MKRGYLYIAVTTLLFSSMEVALKLISGQFNPIQLNFSRFLVGGLVLIPFAVRELKKRGRKLDGKALGSFALLGLMGIAVSMSLYQLSVTRIQASVVGVLFSSNPVFVTLFAFLLLHETISKNQVAGLVLDVAGIVLIIQPWNLKLDTLGVVYVLLATLLFALYGVCGKRQCARFGGLHPLEQPVQVPHLLRFGVAAHPAEPAERDHFAQLQKRIHQFRLRLAAVRHDGGQRLQIRLLQVGRDIGRVPGHDPQKTQPLQLLQTEVHVRLAQTVLLGQFTLRRQPVARFALPAEDFLEHPVKKPLAFRSVFRFLLFRHVLFFPPRPPVYARIVLHFSPGVKRK